MTVKELKEELEFYDADAEVVFELFDDIEVDSWTEDRYGNKSVSFHDTRLKPFFISEYKGTMRIQLEEDKE